MKRNPEISEMRDPTMGHLKKNDPEAKKRALINRMSRAIGHMESVKRMMEDDRDPAEILIQLAAVKSAVTGISRVMLQEHIEEEIREAMENPEKGDHMEDLSKVISYFIK